MNNDKGFFLPIIFVSSLIILLITATLINIYKSEISVTKNLIDQYKVETAIQMSLEKLKQKLHDVEENETGEVNYTLPNQIKTELKYEKIDDHVYKLEHKITLKSGKTYEITQYFPYEIEISVNKNP